MVINKKYLIFKKDMKYFDNVFWCDVLDKTTSDYITFTCTCYYYHTRKEAIDTVFNLFVKVLKNDFLTTSERDEFIKNNNIDFY